MPLSASSLCTPGFTPVQTFTIFAFRIDEERIGSPLFPLMLDSSLKVSPCCAPASMSNETERFGDPLSKGAAGAPGEICKTTLFAGAATTLV
jgi:hypothetical protein